MTVYPTPGLLPGTLLRNEYSPFIKATTCLNHSDPDKTHGKSVTAIGTMVFSPNSIQSVLLPSVPRGSSILRRDPQQDNLDDLLLPRWWWLNTAFLVFIPLEPDFSAYPFNFLLNYSFNRTRRLGFLNILKMLRLRRLEIDLQDFMDEFQGRYKIPSYQAFIEGTAVTFRGHQHLHDLQQEYNRTAEWYTVYAGILLYLVAAAMAIDGDDLKTNLEANLVQKV